MKGPWETDYKFILPNFDNLPDVFKTFMMGLGCVLIKRDVLEKIKFTVEQVTVDGIEANWYDDVFFYDDCQRKNVKCYCVKSLKIPHKIEENKTI